MTALILKSKQLFLHTTTSTSNKQLQYLSGGGGPLRGSGAPRGGPLFGGGMGSLPRGGGGPSLGLQKFNKNQHYMYLIFNYWTYCSLHKRLI